MKRYCINTEKIKVVLLFLPETICKPVKYLQIKFDLGVLYREISWITLCSYDLDKASCDFRNALKKFFSTFS